jgi:hypothetical protein
VQNKAWNKTYRDSRSHERNGQTLLIWNLERRGAGQGESVRVAVEKKAPHCEASLSGAEPYEGMNTVRAALEIRPRPARVLAS